MARAGGTATTQPGVPRGGAGAVPLPPARDLLIALALFAAEIGPLLFFKFRSGYVPGDLNIYREAGRLALHGHTMYGPGFGQDLRVRLPFTYPPFAAFVMVPLSLLPGRGAQVAWTFCNLMLLGVMVWWLFPPALRRAGAEHPVFIVATIGALAWTLPFAQTIAYGQVNIALAFICLVDCTRVSRYRGVLVGIAAAVKLTPGLFIVYFAVTKQWAAALRAAATFLLSQLLAAAIVPGAAHEYWFHLVFESSRPGNPFDYYNQSIFGALRHIGAATWLWAPLVAAVAGVGLWRARTAHRAGAEVAAVALVGLSTVLISPISWQHHAVWILMMFATLAAWADTRRRVIGVFALLALFVVPVPQIGNAMVGSNVLPIVNQLVQNSDVVIYLVVLALLPLIPVTQEERDRAAAPSPVPLPAA